MARCLQSLLYYLLLPQQRTNAGWHRAPSDAGGREGRAGSMFVDSLDHLGAFWEGLTSDTQACHNQLELVTPERSNLSPPPHLPRLELSHLGLYHLLAPHLDLFPCLDILSFSEVINNSYTLIVIGTNLLMEEHLFYLEN